MSDYEENLSGATILEYEVLCDRIRWYFELMDAMSTVHTLLAYVEKQYFEDNLEPADV